MGTTEKIARFITEFQFDKIPPRGIEQSKMSMLDTIGTALLGSKGEAGGIITRFVKQMGGNPQARLIGNGLKTSVEQAALANGTFAHADDFDDTGPFGHPGAFLTASLLTLGEWLKLPGKSIIEGYAIGFEIGSRLAKSLGNIVHAGYHSSCLLGTMAAAAESAKLLGLDVNKTRTALGIAASLASGVMENFGSYTKPFHAGHTSRNGITAALLAREGLTANLDILEGARGFFYVYGQEQASIARMTEHLGKILAIAEESIRIKPWPCCGGNHEALTAMLRIMEKHPIQADEVDSIEVATSWKPPGPCLRTEMSRAFEGKFNLTYNMASVLVDRKIDLGTYREEKFRRPGVQSLMSRVNYVQHPDRRDKPQSLQSESRFAVVTLKLKDGRVLSEHQGVEGRKTLVGEEALAKYRINAEIGGLSPRQIERSIELMDKLETVSNITVLMDTVTAPS